MHYYFKKDLYISWLAFVYWLWRTLYPQQPPLGGGCQNGFIYIIVQGEPHASKQGREQQAKEASSQLNGEIAIKLIIRTSWKS